MKAFGLPVGLVDSLYGQLDVKVKDTLNGRVSPPQWRASLHPAFMPIELVVDRSLDGVVP